MSLAIRGIDAKIELGDTLMNDKFPELKVDYVIANPPFNVGDYNINKTETHKWKFGIPPTGNANYAWLQHLLNKCEKRMSWMRRLNRILKKIGYAI
jgi:type I restriction enzyme M protein